MPARPLGFDAVLWSKQDHGDRAEIPCVRCAPRAAALGGWKRGVPKGLRHRASNTGNRPSSVVRRNSRRVVLAHLRTGDDMLALECCTAEGCATRVALRRANGPAASSFAPGMPSEAAGTALRIEMTELPHWDCWGWRAASPTRPTRSSRFPQRHNRIHLGRSPSRNVASGNRNHEQKQRHH